MKALFSSILFFTTFLLLAQNPILPLNTPHQQLPQNAYLKDTQNQLPPFEGTWVYNQGNLKVTIKFQKIIFYNNLSFYYSDLLTGNYKVEKNGVIIFDNLNMPFNENASIFGFNFYDGKYNMSFIDTVKCDIGGAVKVWINANGKLQWTMHISDYNPWSLDECPEALEPNFHDFMTIPFLMELTKQ